MTEQFDNYGLNQVLQTKDSIKKCQMIQNRRKKVQSYLFSKQKFNKKLIHGKYKYFKNANHKANIFNDGFHKESLKKNQRFQNKRKVSLPSITQENRAIEQKQRKDVFSIYEPFFPKNNSQKVDVSNFRKSQHKQILQKPQQKIEKSIHKSQTKLSELSNYLITKSRQQFEILDSNQWRRFSFSRNKKQFLEKSKKNRSLSLNNIISLRGRLFSRDHKYINSLVISKIS